MKNVLLSVLLVPVLSMLCAAEASALIYHARYLPDIEGVYEPPLAINNVGTVVCNTVVEQSRRLLLWSEYEGLRDTGLMGVRAYDVNDSEQLACHLGDTGANLWSESTGLIDLGSLGFDSGCSLALNNSGSVVGSSYAELESYHAFYWDSALGMVDIGTPAGHQNSEALDISDAGQVVGYSYTWPSTGHAFLWSLADGMQDLGTLGGPIAWATAINNVGQVVGVSSTADGGWAMFVWTPDEGMRSVVPVVGNTAIDPCAINDSGIVVGTIADLDRDTEEAFAWTEDDGLTILGLGNACDINNAGQIVGRVVDGDGVHAVIWEPVPEPASLLALCAGLVPLILRRRR